MIEVKTLTFTVSVAMRDTPIMKKTSLTEDLKGEIEEYLRQLYPMQMILSDDAKLEITLIGESK